jgi:hypothetical protein
MARRYEAEFVKVGEQNIYTLKVIDERKNADTGETVPVVVMTRKTLFAVEDKRLQALSEQYAEQTKIMEALGLASVGN